MVERTIEDRLREEYFALLPEIRLVVEQLETEIRHRLLPILQALNPYERILVTSRVKECESAVDAMRRRQEGATFDREQPERYTLTNLNDLAGVRVLVFPRSRISKIDEALRERFSSWMSDPVPGFDDEDAPVALKYHGYCDASSKVRGEYQMEMGNLTQKNHEAWRRGQVPYLECVFEGSLSKANRILRIIGFHVHDLNMIPRRTVYHQWGKGKTRILRFSKFV